MKKNKVKAKSSKKSDKGAQAEQQGLLDLVSVMAKVAERLETLEKKIEMVLRHTAAASPIVFSQTHASARHDHHAGQEHNMESAHHSSHSGNRHDRILYKAVCADCRRDCEVPFKPSGDRPIYCKDCFAQRKAIQQGKTTIDIPYREPDSIKVAHEGSGKAAAQTAVSASAKARGGKAAKSKR